MGREKRRERKEGGKGDPLNEESEREKCVLKERNGENGGSKKKRSRGGKRGFTTIENHALTA